MRNADDFTILTGVIIIIVWCSIECMINTFQVVLPKTYMYTIHGSANDRIECDPVNGESLRFHLTELIGLMKNAHNTLFWDK